MDAFTKQLCGAVQKHPVLYDNSFDQNSEKETIEEAWKSIAFECNQAISHVKSSWHTIYTNFMTSLNKIKTSSEFYVIEDLKFLLPFAINNNKERDIQKLLASNSSQKWKIKADEYSEKPLLAVKKKHFIVDNNQSNKRKLNDSTIYCIVGEKNTQQENTSVSNTIEIPITEKVERYTADNYSVVGAIQPPHKKLALVIKAIPKTNEMATTTSHYKSIIIEDTYLETEEIDDSIQNNVTICGNLNEESLINQSPHIENVATFESYITTEKPLFDIDGTKDSIIKMENAFHEKGNIENSKDFNDASTQCDYEFDDEDLEFTERLRKWQFKMDARQKILFRKGVYQAYFDAQNNSLICEACKDDFAKPEMDQSNLKDYKKSKSIKLCFIRNLANAGTKQKPALNSTSTNQIQQVTSSPMQPKIFNKKNPSCTNEILTVDSSNLMPQKTDLNVQLQKKPCRIVRNTPILLPYKKLYETYKPTKSVCMEDSNSNDAVIHTNNNLQNSLSNTDCTNEIIFTKSGKLALLKNEHLNQKKPQDANATIKGKCNILNFKEIKLPSVNNITTTMSSTGAIITMKNVTNTKLCIPKPQEEAETQYLNVQKLLETPMNLKAKVLPPKNFHICNVSTNFNKASIIEISDKLNTESQPISPNVQLLESVPKTVQQQQQIQSFQTLDYKDTANCDDDVIPNDQVNSNENMDCLVTSDFETFIKNELRTLKDEYD